jgi:hypothetical protein
MTASEFIGRTGVDHDDVFFRVVQLLELSGFDGRRAAQIAHAFRKDDAGDIEGGQSVEAIRRPCRNAAREHVDVGIAEAFERRRAFRGHIVAVVDEHEPHRLARYEAQRVPFQVFCRQVGGEQRMSFCELLHRPQVQQREFLAAAEAAFGQPRL